MNAQRIVLNKNLVITERGDKVEFLLKERRVSINMTKKAYVFLQNLLAQNMSKADIDAMRNAKISEFLSPLYFNDVLLKESENELLEYGLLFNPARMQTTVSLIPEKHIEQWCFFGAPADFALDPPRSPAHGSYIYRKLGKSHQKMIDLGDIAYVTTDNLYKFGGKIRHAIRRIRNRKNRVIMIGGDHSLTYFALKELSKNNKDVVLVQFDAHSDINVSTQKNNELLHHANFVSKLIDERAVSGVIQIGVRETARRYSVNYLREHSVIQIPSLLDSENEKLIKDMIKGRSVYISFDMDVLDPIIFPHVTTPLGCGLSESEALHIIDFIKKNDCHVDGADIMEFTCGFDKKGQFFNDEISLIDNIITKIIE